LAFGSFHGDVTVLESDLRLTDGDGFFSDTTHDSHLRFAIADLRFVSQSQIANRKSKISLAHRAQQFAADVLLAGAAIAHHAFARGHNRDAHAVEHRGQLAHAAIHAAAGLAGAVDRVDHLFAGHRVLELDADLALLRVFDDIVVIDVALVLENLRDAATDFAPGDEDHPTPDAVGVADSRQHVGDGI